NTIGQSFRYLPYYIASLSYLHEMMNKYEIDIIINLYDILGGFYNGIINHNKRPFLCAAHQYLLLHPKFPHPKGYFWSRAIVNLNSQITSLGAVKRIALSFDPQVYDKQFQLETAPPLVRRKAQGQIGQQSDDILAYVNMPAMAEELVSWYREEGIDSEVHCFWSGSNDTCLEPPAGFKFHDLDGQKYLDYMSRCRLLISTAGFESICEAFLRGIRVITRPMPNHYEQLCNSIDAQRVGIGIHCTPDLQTAYNALPQGKIDTQRFESWVSQSKDLWIQILNKTMVRRRKHVTIRTVSLFARLILFPIKRIVKLVLNPVKRVALLRR
ncbi:MAG: glycosyltransferase family protein, partial [Bacteroidota bacterium]